MSCGTPVPPSNLEFEQCLLRAILTGAPCPDFLGGQHFADPIHGMIYSTAAHFQERRKVSDHLALTMHFERSGELAEMGGTKYLSHLLYGARPAVMTPREYARAIHDLWVERIFFNLLLVTTKPPSVDGPQEMLQ
jgi:replicative DNA helicase